MARLKPHSPTQLKARGLDPNGRHTSPRHTSPTQQRLVLAVEQPEAAMSPNLPADADDEDSNDEIERFLSPKIPHAAPTESPVSASGSGAAGEGAEQQQEPSPELEVPAARAASAVADLPQKAPAKKTPIRYQMRKKKPTQPVIPDSDDDGTPAPAAGGAAGQGAIGANMDFAIDPALLDPSIGGSGVGGAQNGNGKKKDKGKKRARSPSPVGTNYSDEPGVQSDIQVDDIQVNDFDPYDIYVGSSSAAGPSSRKKSKKASAKKEAMRAARKKAAARHVGSDSDFSSGGEEEYDASGALIDSSGEEEEEFDEDDYSSSGEARRLPVKAGVKLKKNGQPYKQRKSRAGGENPFKMDRNKPGARVPWTNEEELLLIKELMLWGHDWAFINYRHGINGTESTTLGERNNVSLKDKVRNMRKKLEKNRGLVPLPDYILGRNPTGVRGRD